MAGQRASTPWQWYNRARKRGRRDPRSLPEWGETEDERLHHHCCGTAEGAKEVDEVVNCSFTTPTINIDAKLAQLSQSMKTSLDIYEGNLNHAVIHVIVKTVRADQMYPKATNTH
jgi:hypothetical protein